MCEIAYTLYPCGDSLSHYCTDTYSTRPSLNCKQCKRDERTQVEFTRGRRITAPYERYVWIWICMKKTTIQRSYVRNSFRWHLNPFSTTSRCNYVYSVSVCVSVFCFGIWGIIYVAPRLVESEKLPVKQIMSIYVVWYTEAQWSSTPVFGLFTALSLSVSLTHSRSRPLSALAHCKCSAVHYCWPYFSLSLLSCCCCYLDVSLFVIKCCLFNIYLNISHVSNKCVVFIIVQCYYEAVSRQLFAQQPHADWIEAQVEGQREWQRDRKEDRDRVRRQKGTKIAPV